MKDAPVSQVLVLIIFVIQFRSVVVSADTLTTSFGVLLWCSNFSQLKWRQKKNFLSYLNLSGDREHSGNDRKNNLYVYIAAESCS